MTEKNEPSRAAGLVTVQLGVALKTDWVQWCQARNLVPGKALRSLVENALSEGSELSTSTQETQTRDSGGYESGTTLKVGREPDVGPKVGREIYFTPSENAAVIAASDAKGLGFHEWVIAAIRAALTLSPSYGQPELEALTQSNTLLVQIAADLTVLRKNLTDADLSNRFRVLENGVRTHVEAASAAMAQGAQRWQLKV